MSKFQVGDTAYVPTTLLDLEGAYALTKRRVLAVDARSITVDLQGGQSIRVASARAHKAPLGVLVINVGDLRTATDLERLANSIDAYLRLLLPDDQVKRLDIRTFVELKQFWRDEHATASHVVLAGHGSRDGFPFLDRDSAISGRAFAEDLQSRSTGLGARRLQFLSLACETGRREVAGQISRSPICGDFIGPFRPVHAASAAHFCQTYFASHLLEGRVPKGAFESAQRAVRGDAGFRLWRDGALVAS
jgi:hypothetical protein